MSEVRTPGAPAALPRPRRLVGLASALVDVVVDLPALPPRGGDVVALGSAEVVGGGVNVLRAGRAFGLAAAYAAPHGTGRHGDAVRAALADAGVSALLAPRTDADTGFCVGMVEPDGERTYLTVPGVEAAPTPGELAGLGLTGADAVYVSGYDLVYATSRDVLGAFLAALAPGPALVLDPGPLVAEIPPGLLAAVLRRLDLLSLNAREARLMLGAAAPTGDDPGPLAAALSSQLSDHAVAVVRAGARGAAAARGATVAGQADALAVEVRDTSGAGDVHTGVLLARLGAGADLAAALATATAAASLSVTRAGPAAVPDPAELVATLG